MNKTQEEIDKEFIRNESKSKISYKEIKNISYELLSDFENELNLHSLAINACGDNNYEMLKFLIYISINVNEKDNFGTTLLHFSCSYNSYECADILINNGAKINVLNDWGLMPKDFLDSESSYELCKLLEDNGAKRAYR